MITFIQFINESAAWQRKEGKNSEGGLNQKGVDSYRAANPGSKLQTAVTTDPSKLKKGCCTSILVAKFCVLAGSFNNAGLKSEAVKIS